LVYCIPKNLAALNGSIVQCGQLVIEDTACGSSSQGQGCQIILYMIPKPVKMYQMNIKCIKWSQHTPNIFKIFQMALEYINIFPSEAIQDLLKFGFLV
jgi:hypothetical protein